MVIYSNEIKDFLDKIYFHELTHRNDLDFPLYNYYKDKLSFIDKMSIHTPSTTFPMSRDKLFGLIVGRLEFGYSFDGINACVEYYVNREPQNDWFDWMIKESKDITDSDNGKCNPILIDTKKISLFSIFEFQERLNRIK